MRKDKISLGWKVVLLVVLVLVIDQIVKIWVKTGFDVYEQRNVIDGFFQLYYIENRGMAFGTTLGNGVLAKYALSIFRLVAIIGIGYYIFKLVKEKNVHTGLIYAVGLIFAGAMGNLIDGMLYDYIWSVDCDVKWNIVFTELDGGGVQYYCREQGFLLGSVVDMFQFTLKWPKGTPFGLGGQQIFGAIWNVADASITVGVGIIIFRYKVFFKKTNDQPENPDSAVNTESPQEAES